MAIVGGAIFPPIMGLMADTIGIQESFAIPAVCFLVVFYYGFRGYSRNESSQ
jgi:FHS family L-fucose permease-like MFS transporter